MKGIGIETENGGPDGTEGLKEEAMKEGGEISKNMDEIKFKRFLGQGYQTLPFLLGELPVPRPIRLGLGVPLPGSWSRAPVFTAPYMLPGQWSCWPVLRSAH